MGGWGPLIYYSQLQIPAARVRVRAQQHGDRVWGTTGGETRCWGVAAPVRGGVSPSLGAQNKPRCLKMHLFGCEARGMILGEEGAKTRRLKIPRSAPSRSEPSRLAPRRLGAAPGSGRTELSPPATQSGTQTNTEPRLDPETDRETSCAGKSSRYSAQILRSSASLRPPRKSRLRARSRVSGSVR